MRNKRPCADVRLANAPGAPRAQCWKLPTLEWFLSVRNTRPLLRSMLVTREDMQMRATSSCTRHAHASPPPRLCVARMISFSANVPLWAKRGEHLSVRGCVPSTPTAARWREDAATLAPLWSVLWQHGSGSLKAKDSTRSGLLKYRPRRRRRRRAGAAARGGGAPFGAMPLVQC